MSQRQQLERIFEIDRCIRASEYPNAERLSRKLEVSRRVIFNDRAFMIDRLGAPIEYDRFHNGWIYSNSTWVLPNIMVTEGELLAFFLSVYLAQRYLGTAFEPALRSAVEKIGRTIKGPVSIDLETLRAHYTFAAPVLATANERALLDLHGAIAAHKRVWMRYYTASRGELTERTISPYHLINIRGDWYLVAYDDLRQETRNFLVGRIEDWKVMTETFLPDKTFSIERWMQNAFQTERGGEPQVVEIRFDAYQARYLRERCWHETQRIEELPGGGLILRFCTGGLGEVRRWVLGYGSHAEVLAPQSLREEVQNEILKMSQIYNGKEACPC